MSHTRNFEDLCKENTLIDYLKTLPLNLKMRLP